MPRVITIEIDECDERCPHYYWNRSHHKGYCYFAKIDRPRTVVYSPSNQFAIERGKDNFPTCCGLPKVVSLWDRG